MPSFTAADGTLIDYEDRGQGPCVVLLHGFGADRELNWVRPGVLDALVRAGRRVVAPDARGHGRSGKPHDPARYKGDVMVGDVVALLDHLGLERCSLVGYSMGSLTALGLLPIEPRIDRAVLGGVGGRLGAEGPPRRPAVAEGLLADDPSTITDPVARAFRAFADATGADRRALAAIQLAPRALRGDPAAITVPVLVLTGRDDVLVGPPEGLAARIEGARVTVVGGDHLSAVADPAFAPAIVGFLDEA